MDSVKNVFRRRDRMVAALWSVVKDADKITDFELARAAEVARAVLPSDCPYTSVYRSLSSFLGQAPDRDALRRHAWALSGNVPAVRTGAVVVPGRFDNGADVTIQVMAARRRRSRNPKAEPAAHYRGRIVIGPGAPATLDWSWSFRFVSYLATRPDGMGFDRRFRPGTRPYEHFLTFVGMRFVATIEIDEGRPRVAEVRCGGHRTYNRKLIDMRRRTTFDCPFNYDVPCHNCFRGQSSCPAACRSLDLIRTTCACGREFDADPAWNELSCHTCEARLGRRPK